MHLRSPTGSTTRLWCETRSRPCRTMFVGVWLAGGTEKLRGGDDYGVPVVDDLEAAIAELEPELVIDLSDEPVLGPRERFRTASRVLALGLPYVGSDFRFDPPELAPFPLPSLSVVGTGKRVGKTAVTGHLARLLAADRDVVVVAMGRGGPPEPEVAEAGRRSSACSSCRAKGAMRPPTTSRPQLWRAS